MGAVPRIPIVATGVSMRISPVGATCPATKENVPCTMLKLSALLSATRLVDQIVEHHPRIARQVEDRAVGEDQTDRRS